MSDPTLLPSTPAVPDLVPALARELDLTPAAVRAVVALLAEGNTVPFIARYRKERTGSLDEVQIRAIEERQAYRLELEQRRAVVLASIDEQGKLSDELAARLRAADTKAMLEDLYAPFRPRRKTRASTARERGLEPLALRILAQAADGDPGADAAAFVTELVATAADALAGARDIAAEIIADTAEVRALCRIAFGERGEVVSERVAETTTEPTKYEPYYDFREVVRTIPSHRFLAIRRGEAEGFLRAQVTPGSGADEVVAGIERLVKLDAGSPWAAPLREAVADAYKRLLAPAVENDVRAELKLRSDAAAVDVFADNLRNLLLQAPLGSRPVIGIDPGLRTGCKCAAVDATGTFLGSITVFLSQGEAAMARAREELAAFIVQHDPVAIAIGNGTGGRDAEGFVRKLLAAEPAPAAVVDPAAMAAAIASIAQAAAAAASAATDPASAAAAAGAAAAAAVAALTPPAAPAPTRWVVSVNEAGASVYSASDVARAEFPDLDLTIRGAISIARRLQDPLAELVKIEPKAIGVGQYQHDVHQPLLGKQLGDVVESCVNHVGVELNTASAELLGYVAGIGKALAKKIVLHRTQHGAFRSRQQLLEVGGLGPRAFEQCAGFMRIHGSEHPLDASGVHPERYGLVERMAGRLGVEVAALVGNKAIVDTIDLGEYLDGEVGMPTLLDILAELKKPGRDPRAGFSPPKFRDDVTTLHDLKEGMVLEGVVTNVTAFGAFVDVGVHQDGLVHVSRLSRQFVKDPAEVVKVGDRLTVRVLSVDLERRRIALSARPPEAESRDGRGGQGRRNDRGGEQRGGEQRGGEQRGGEQRGGEQRGGSGGGGPRGGGGGGAGPRGGGGPRVGEQRGGPRGGGPRGGGPRDGGPRDGVPQDARPPQDGRPPDGRPPQDGRPLDGRPRDDRRGPRQGPPGQGAAGPTGPGGGPGGGPRGDRGPRRDDRRPDQRDGRPPDARRTDERRDEPRRDDRGADAPAQQGKGFGVSGFVNNPFAKLGTLKDKN